MKFPNVRDGRLTSIVKEIARELRQSMGNGEEVINKEEAIVVFVFFFNTMGSFEVTWN